MTLTLLLLFQGAMMLAATCDIFTMTIPNRLTGLLMVAFLPAAVLLGLPLTIIGWHIVVGAVALAVGFLFFSRGWIGGGDAKFCAATALWLGPSLILEYLLISTVLGGAITLLILLVRQYPLPQALNEQGWLSRLHDHRSGIPYGIALALGGLIVAPKLPWAAALLG